MQRRHFLFLAPLLPSALFVPPLLRARARQSRPHINVADAALRIDQLASNIHSPADARRFVDFIAELFADELPPAWAIDAFRKRVAECEYLAVTNPQQRIPEEHLAAAWNAYVGTIHAPRQSQASSAEIHNLRDALFSTARVIWSRGSRNFWAVPSIFATQADGTLAAGCRAVESVRIVWDLANMPDNLLAARDRVSKGILMSDLFRQAQQKPRSSPGGQASISMRVGSNPVESAANQYIRENGMSAFSNTVETMLDNLLTI